jgi:hypothetical protein
MISTKDKVKSKKSLQESTIFEDPTVVTASPSEGVLQPNSDIIVEFTFRPKEEKERTGFKAQAKKDAPKQYISRLQVQMLESVMSSAKDEPLDLQFKGRTSAIAAKLSADAVHFEQLLPGQDETREITISNKSRELPVVFSIDRVANFKVSPNCGRLAPSGSQVLQVTFSPNQIGDLSKVVKIQMRGSSSGKVLTTLKFRAVAQCIAECKVPIRTHPGFEDKDSDLVTESFVTIPSTVRTCAASTDTVAVHGVTRFNKLHDEKTPINQERVEFEQHRNVYGELIRQTRKMNLLETRRAIFLGQRENENQLDNKRKTEELIEEWRKTDIDNGYV